MKVRIIVTLKDIVLDPQGLAVMNALHTLGYSPVTDVRQGKIFDITLNGITKKQAEKMIPEISDKVLANPIIETFDWQFVKEKGDKKTNI